MASSRAFSGQMLPRAASGIEPVSVELAHGPGIVRGMSLAVWLRLPTVRARLPRTPAVPQLLYSKLRKVPRATPQRSCAPRPFALSVPCRAGASAPNRSGARVSGRVLLCYPPRVCGGVRGCAGSAIGAAGSTHGTEETHGAVAEGAQHYAMFESGTFGLVEMNCCVCPTPKRPAHTFALSDKCVPARTPNAARCA